MAAININWRNIDLPNAVSRKLPKGIVPYLDMYNYVNASKYDDRKL